MKVVVDTSIWSAALRRNSTAAPSGEVPVLERLIRDYRVVMLGAIRQELLSGIRDALQFARLRDKLHAFPDLNLTEADYETAVQFFNLCRTKGIQGSNTDFLICAAAVRRNLPVFTADKDFLALREHTGLALYRQNVHG